MVSPMDGRKIVVPLSLLALLSMITGYVREVVIAARFGAGLQADAYLSVVTIVRFVCDVGPCAVLLACVVPVLASLQAGSIELRCALLTRVVLLVLAVTLLLALGLGLLMPWLLTVAAPGFGAEARQTGLELSASMVWYLPLQSLNFLFALALNAHGRFRLAAVGPVLANLIFLLLLLAAGTAPAVGWLAVATLAGPLVSASLLGWRLWRMGLFGLSKAPGIENALRTLWQAARPMALSLGLGSSTGLLIICHLLLRRHGSLAGEGSVAALAYAYRIYELPVSLIANIAGTLALPSLSAMHAANDRQRIASICRGLLEWGLLLLLPMVVVTVFNARLLVDLLLAHGRFGAEDAARTAAALQGFAPVILFESALVVFYRVAYALRRAKAALLASVATLVTLVALLQVVPPQQVLLLTASFSLSFAVGALVLAWRLWEALGKGLQPFAHGALPLLAVLGLSGAVWLPLAAHPLPGALVYAVTYMAAGFMLLPRHRGALISLLRGRA